MDLIKKIFKNVSLPVAYCESNGEILFANDAWRNAIITRKNIGTSKKKSIPSDLLPLFDKVMGENKSADNFEVSIDDRPFVANFIKLSKTNALIFLFYQISQHALPEIDLEINRLNERIVQLETFLESSFDGFWICDKHGNVIQINKAAERLNSLEGENVIGRNVKELVNEGYYDRSVTLEVLKSKKTETAMVNSRSGNRLLATGTPLFDAVGEIRHVIVNVRDITILEDLREKLEKTEALSKRYQHEVSKLYTMRDLKKKMIYCSPQMDKIINFASRAAATDATVLLTGESGVGKGLIAEWIHLFSDRGKGPFFNINCAMLPAHLIESELFGYKSGAFTGAHIQGKPGLVEMADKGTLLLDEIGDLPLSLQVKLLEFLETKAYTQIGSVNKKKLDVRIICATNKDLKKEIKNSKFRTDLYFRLNAVPIEILPLRQRKEDVPILISHFLDFYNKKHAKNIRLTPMVVNQLLNFDYPGNVRELKHLIERIVVLADRESFDICELEAFTIDSKLSEESKARCEVTMGLAKAKEIFERDYIQNAIRTSRNQNEAAKLLEIDQSTISRKIKRYNLIDRNEWNS